MRIRHLAGIATVIGLGSILLTGCVIPGQKPAEKQAKATPSPVERCMALAALKGKALKTLPDPSLVVTSATINPATPAKPAQPGSRTGPVPAMPEHCEVLGQLRQHKGIDGQTYAIKFRLRLPTDWNGRFFYEGSGGANGTVGLAAGRIVNAPDTALERGYAVLSQDSGHDNAVNSNPDRQGTIAFGFDPQARRDYGYASYGVSANTAKALIKLFYGRGPEHSYFVGCSNGGREGMIFAQRYPEIFDGIVAASPAFALPKPALAEVWDTQAFAQLAGKMGLIGGNGLPDINKTYSDKDLALVSQAVLQACDALDGLKDGMINAFTKCTTDQVSPALEEKICQGPKTDSCLTADQVATLKRVFNGAHKSDGTMLYANWPWDRGIGGKIGNGYYQGWRIWKIGSYDGKTPAINVVLGGPAMSVFTDTPKPLHDDPTSYLTFMLNYDMNKDSDSIYATNDTYTKSAWDVVSARSTDLSAFKAHGGKMIVPQGVSDPIFSIDDTIDWWKAVNKRQDGHARDFVRLFPVPGMNHCGGGPATDEFDSLVAIVDWVENGIAPDRIRAIAGSHTPWPGRSRPLCPYPQIAEYRGSGSIEDASNFVCR